MRAHNRKEFKLADKRLTNLEDAITKEVEDRVTESDELIYETRDDLQNLQSQFDEECQTRNDREKDIL
jgi:vacuolar-type H+-ATPase subunit H